MLSHLLSKAKWCTRLLLHSVLLWGWNKQQQGGLQWTCETYLSYIEANNSKRLWVTSIKMHSNDTIMLWSKKMALFCSFSASAYVATIPQQLCMLQTWTCFTGRTYLTSGTCFSFPIAVDKKWIRCCIWNPWWQPCNRSHNKIPQAFSLCFRILQTIKNWRCRLIEVTIFYYQVKQFHSVFLFVSIYGLKWLFCMFI